MWSRRRPSSTLISGAATATGARRLLVAHDLVRKPLHTFRDHALMDRLRVEHLEVHYGDLVGVADVSLDVQPGSIVALLGSNGAGKTTTLNCIAGLVRPSGGRIEWRDAPIGGEPGYAIVSKGLALSPEGWRLFVTQTIEQNPRLGATGPRHKGQISPP